METAQYILKETTIGRYSISTAKFSHYYETLVFDDVSRMGVCQDLRDLLKGNYGVQTESEDSAKLTHDATVLIVRLFHNSL